MYAKLCNSWCGTSEGTRHSSTSAGPATAPGSGSGSTKRSAKAQRRAARATERDRHASELAALEAKLALAQVQAAAAARPVPPALPAPALPAVPTISDRTSWFRAWRVLQFYFRTPTYSPGPEVDPEVDLRQVAGGPGDNSSASANVAALIEGKLAGDAFNFIKHRRDLDRDGFGTLRLLKDKFGVVDARHVAAEMIDFFGGFDQGTSSIVEYESDLCDYFERFARAGFSLPVLFQLVFMIRGLLPADKDVVVRALRDGALALTDTNTSELRDKILDHNSPCWTRIAQQGRVEAPACANQTAATGDRGKRGGGGGGGGGGGSGAGDDHDKKGGGGQQPNPRTVIGKRSDKTLTTMFREWTKKGNPKPPLCGACHRPVTTDEKFFVDGKHCKTGIVGCSILAKAQLVCTRVESSSKSGKKKTTEAAKSAASADAAGGATEDDQDASGTSAVAERSPSPAASFRSVETDEDFADTFCFPAAAFRDYDDEYGSDGSAARAAAEPVAGGRPAKGLGGNGSE